MAYEMILSSTSFGQLSIGDGLAEVWIVRVMSRRGYSGWEFSQGADATCEGHKLVQWSEYWQITRMHGPHVPRPAISHILRLRLPCRQTTCLRPPPHHPVS